MRYFEGKFEWNKFLVKKSSQIISGDELPPLFGLFLLFAMFLSCVSFLSCILVLSVIWFLLKYCLELSELASVLVLGKQERSWVCCIYNIHPWSTSPEFAHILESLAQFKHDFGALFVRPLNAHFTYFKKNKLSFFQCTDHWKIVFNSWSVENADCRMHC